MQIIAALMRVTYKISPTHPGRTYNNYGLVINKFYPANNKISKKCLELLL